MEKGQVTGVQDVQTALPGVAPNFATWAREWYQRRYPHANQHPEWPSVLTLAQQDVPYRFIPQAELADQWVSRNLWTTLRRDGKVMKRGTELDGTPIRQVAVQMELPWPDFRAEALHRLRLTANDIGRVEADVAEYIARHPSLGLDVVTELTVLRMELVAA